jgi:hypothetical protein
MLDKDDPRRPEAVRLANALEPRVPELRVLLDPEAPRSARVFRDGVELGTPSLGVALPVDPGRHVVEVRLDGHSTRRFEITIEEGQTQQLVVAPGPARKQPPATPQAAESDPLPDPTVDQEPARRRSRGAHVAGLTLVTLGATGLIAGGVTGVLAMDEKQTMGQQCLSHNGQLYCEDPGVEASRDGKRLANLSTIGFVAGGAALATGVTLLLVSRHQRRHTSVHWGVAPCGASVSLVRQF